MPFFVRRVAWVFAILIGVSACEERQQIQAVSDIELLTLEGNKELLSKWRGKTIVLNVWATWCAPCRKEMPDLQSLSERLDPARIQVLGVSVDKNPDMVKEYLRENAITFARHIDPDKKMTRGRLDVTSLPQTLIIDPEGRLRERFIGLKDWSSVGYSELSQN